MTNASAPQHWTTWSSARGYPLSADEERKLIDEFRNFTGTKPARDPKVLTDRQVASLLLTLIRDGGTLEDLTAITPQLNPTTLADIYDRVQTRLDAARKAWNAVVADPNNATEHLDDVARVLPQLANILRSKEGEDTTDLVQRMAAKVDATTVQIDEIEHEMHRVITDLERDNKHYSLVRAASCLWNDNMFLPERVGQLTPTRLAFILEDNA